MLHEELRLELRGAPAPLFEYLDDPCHLSDHMQRRGPALAGGAMKLVADPHRGLGSGWRLKGRVVGLTLQADVQVTEYQPPWRKTWQTVAEPRLLVMGAYRMGFELQSQAAPTVSLRLWLDFEPTRRGRWVARAYARCCLREMAAAARRAGEPSA